MQIRAQMLADDEPEGVRLKLVDLKVAKEVTNCILSMEENKYETMILMWSWWDVRNKVNAREQRRTVEVVHPARNMTWDVCTMLKKWDVCTMLKKTVEKHHKKVQRWNPPLEEVLKVNIDGAFLMEQKSGGWGFIVRDADGNAVMAGAGRLESVHDSFLQRLKLALWL
ncbi:hypothetical protein SEVIR_9G060751v4 [Setaria viridis]